MNAQNEGEKLNPNILRRASTTPKSVPSMASSCFAVFQVVIGEAFKLSSYIFAAPGHHLDDLTFSSWVAGYLDCRLYSFVKPLSRFRLLVEWW